MPVPLRVLFPYLGQRHHVLHSLPIAAAMAEHYPQIDVHVASASQENLSFIRRLLNEYAPAAPVQLDTLRLPSWWPNKRRTILLNRPYLKTFDAIVTPERKLLRHRIGSTRLIWTKHGAGDRAKGFPEDIYKFDYVLLGGEKTETRFLEKGLIRPGHYTTGIYAKFDWLGAARPRQHMFDNERPTILYSPHFEPELSSWKKFGVRILDFFAASERYNLIFAPHVRLFYPPNRGKYAPFDRYLRLPHIKIDLGSESSCDMSYLNSADLYLGDVSSQVTEFVCRPRPCVFLNAHGISWQGDPSYRFWSLGQVVEEVDTLERVFEEAFTQHGRYVEIQKEYMKDSFGIAASTSSAARGADAIASFLNARQ